MIMIIIRRLDGPHRFRLLVEHIGIRTIRQGLLKVVQEQFCTTFGVTYELLRVTHEQVPFHRGMIRQIRPNVESASFPQSGFPIVTGQRIRWQRSVGVLISVPRAWEDGYPLPITPIRCTAV